MKSKKKPKPRGYWTKDRVLAQAKKYKTASNWKKNCPSSNRTAVKYGWYKEAQKLLNRQTRIITKEDVFTKAIKYKRRVDFQKKDASYYAKAQTNGWLEECCSHMMSFEESKEKGRYYRWTRESILKEVKKFKKFSELTKKNTAIYEAIVRLDMLKEVQAQLIIGKELKWTYEKLKAIALKYETKQEFKKHNAGALRKIYKEGLVQELLSHMKTATEQTTKWTDDKILAAILECKTKTNLRNDYPGAYFRMNQNKSKFIHLFPKPKKKNEKVKKSTKTRIPRTYWTKVKVIEEAKKHNTYSEWKAASGTCVRVASEKGWVKLVSPYFRKKNSPSLRKWLFKKLKNIKKEYYFKKYRLTTTIKLDEKDG